jgi:hypothetical protein
MRRPEKGTNISPSRYGPIALAVVLTLIGIISVLRYAYFVRNLTNYNVTDLPSYIEPEFPELDARQIANLGWAHTTTHHPKSSYVNVQRKKNAGAQRIGIFGDSFVEGLETEYGFDFPSLLEKKLHDAGLPTVQVINFGVRSYGVHQSYLLWEYLAKGYGLDYVVIVPSAFHEEYDSSFLYAYNSFGPVHARYILDHERARLVSVIGATRQEADRAYNRIVLPWRYIRYDDKAPIFLRALVPMDWKITINPFYYRLFDKHQEVLKTYELLIEDWAAQAKNVLVLCDDKDICGMQKAIRRDNVYFVESRVSNAANRVPELYRAPRGHFSALGNQLRANELYLVLVGKNDAQCDLIEFSPSRGDTASRPSNVNPLYEYENIAAKIADQGVADLVIGRDVLEERPDFQRHTTAALLGTRTDKGITFIPFKFLLREKDQLFFSFMLDAEPVMIPLGRISASASVMGEIPITGLDEREGRFVSKAGREVSWSGDLHQITLRTKGSIEDMAIVVEDRSRIVLRGEAESVQKRIARSILRGEQRFIFRPAAGEYVYLRVKAGESADIDRISENGTLDLVLTKKNGEKDRVSILGFHKTTARCSSSDRAYPNSLSPRR